MSIRTKSVVRVITFTGGMVPVFFWLAVKTGSGVFIALSIIAACVGIGLLFYAAVREKTTGDKSEPVSRKSAVMIFCCVGVWVAFVFYRALTH